MKTMKVICALDVGNQNVKLKFSVDQEDPITIVVPSNLQILSDIEEEPSGFAYFGDNSDWCPKYWIPQSPVDSQWVLDDDEGKPQLALPLLLSALYDHLETESEIDLVTSIHNVAALGDHLHRALEGMHIVSRGADDAKTFHINVVRVFAEGVGTLREVKPTTYKNWLLDLGGGTIIGTAFDRLRIMQGCAPYPLVSHGTCRLIQEFSKCEEVSRTLGNVLTYEQARTVIDDPKHRFKLAGKAHNFSTAVEQEVGRWVPDIISRVERMARHHLTQCDNKLATGGACLIPSVKLLLKDAGYSVADDPLNSNVNGIFDWLRSR